MVTLVVKYAFPSDRLAEAEAHMRDLVRHSREEPGCRRFDIVRSTDDDREFLFMEAYDDAAALDAHRASEHFARAGLDGIRKLAASREAQQYVDFA